MLTVKNSPPDSPDYLPLRVNFYQEVKIPGTDQSIPVRQPGDGISVGPAFILNIAVGRLIKVVTGIPRPEDFPLWTNFLHLSISFLVEVTEYVERNIGIFHKARLDRIRKLKLTDILLRKNPYLFKARNILLSQDLVKILLDAHLSSQEEAIFGNFLEGLAIFINQKVYNGWKSSAQGIDLEFNNDDKRYIVAIKSGPNWANSDHQCHHQQ